MQKLRLAGWILLGLVIVLGAARLLTRPIPPPYRFLKGAAYQGTNIDKSGHAWRTYRMAGRVEEVVSKAQKESFYFPPIPGNSSSMSTESSGPDGMEGWSTQASSDRFGLEYGISVDAGPKGTVVVRVLNPPTLWARFLRFVRFR